MPPKGKASHESLKQKSLMTWFSKDSAKSTKTPSSSRNVDPLKKQTDSGKSASHGQLLPPSSSPGSYKSIDMDYDEDTVPYSATLEVPASTPSRQGSTPPTSDVTDIDMLQIDDDEDETGNVPLSTRVY
jgi:DNA mismatch repair protein MSH6